jgi:hypothetical protein
VTLAAELTPELAVGSGPLWRVAHPPEPWAWLPCQPAPFEGRWDDAKGQFAW